jgi:hypothetical protein
MHEPVHGGHRHGLVWEDLVPRREWRIGRDRDALALGMAGHVASQKAQELAQHRVVNFGACCSGCHGAARLSMNLLF